MKKYMIQQVQLQWFVFSKKYRDIHIKPHFHIIVIKREAVNGFRGNYLKK